MMDFEGLESFLSVAQTKSISKASHSLHITQPTLSTRIRKLEEELGFNLLTRSWEGVTLTKEGYYFLPHAIQLLRELSNASIVLTDTYVDQNKYSFKEVSNDPEVFRIGINLWLAPIFVEQIISELTLNYPNVKYRFVTRPTDTLKDLMEYQGTHLNIYYQNERETTYPSTPIFEDEMGLVCSKKDYEFINNDIKNLKSLNKPYLLFDNPVLANNMQLINRSINYLDIDKFQVVDDLNIMSTYISSGIGYSVLPNSIYLHYLKFGSDAIKMVLPEISFPTIPIHLEYNPNPCSPFRSPILSIQNKLLQFCKNKYAS